MYQEYALKDGWVWQDGKKLPRTLAFAALQNVQVERPCDLYLIANQLENMVKVGISHQPSVRRSQLEQQYPELGKLKILQTFATRSFANANQIEVSIHAFLNKLGRGPVLDREWFKPKPHDTWLIRYLMNETPTRFVASLFNDLNAGYFDLLAEYTANPDYVAEEVLLGYGRVIFSHFRHETEYKGEVGFKSPNPITLPTIALPAAA